MKYLITIGLVLAAIMFVAWCFMRMARKCDDDEEEKEEEVAYVQRCYCSKCPYKRTIRDAEAAGNLVWMQDFAKRKSAKENQ